MEKCGGRTIVLIFFKNILASLLGKHSVKIGQWLTLLKKHFSFFCKQPYNLDFQEDILRVAAVSNMAKIP